MSRSPVLILASLLAAAVMFVPTATAQTTGKARPKEKVTGLLTFREDLEFLPGTKVEVEIREESDVPSVIKPVGKLIIRNPKKVPIPFVVEYDPRDIKKDKRYLLHVRIFDTRQVRYTGGPGVAVITQKKPTRDLRIPMVPVRSSESIR